eukprot:CAMPEP_0184708164 /NCGR_PEP_ID=MMETSP0313-20130426/37636_1 /TAXON_ID=2792 /ORGANISM="Porphyridium aerugineum, Strain SAG 1380-2" /LENGTH=738 /DNA_ID=CAMNT_0027169747 /DNA_START=277 /DNA_END=2494 /DNA_ORIENTATION=+
MNNDNHNNDLSLSWTSSQLNQNIESATDSLDMKQHAQGQEDSWTVEGQPNNDLSLSWTSSQLNQNIESATDSLDMKQHAQGQEDSWTVEGWIESLRAGSGAVDSSSMASSSLSSSSSSSSSSSPSHLESGVMGQQAHDNVMHYDAGEMDSFMDTFHPISYLDGDMAPEIGDVDEEEDVGIIDQPDVIGVAGTIDGHMYEEAMYGGIGYMPQTVMVGGDEAEGQAEGEGVGVGVGVGVEMYEQDNVVVVSAEDGVAIPMESPMGIERVVVKEEAVEVLAGNDSDQPCSMDQAMLMSESQTQSEQEKQAKPVTQAKYVKQEPTIALQAKSNSNHSMSDNTMSFSSQHSHQRTTEVKTARARPAISKRSRKAEAVDQAKKRAEAYANSQLDDRRGSWNKEHRADGDLSEVDLDNIDDEEIRDSAKYRRRLQKNRDSAFVSRIRRRAYTQFLEESLCEHENENKRLKQETDALRQQVEKLKTLMNNQLGSAVAPSGNDQNGKQVAATSNGTIAGSSNPSRNSSVHDHVSSVSAVQEHITVATMQPQEYHVDPRVFDQAMYSQRPPAKSISYYDRGDENKSNEAEDGKTDSSVMSMGISLNSALCLFLLLFSIAIPKSVSLESALTLAFSSAVPFLPMSGSGNQFMRSSLLSHAPIANQEHNPKLYSEIGYDLDFLDNYPALLTELENAGTETNESQNQSQSEDEISMRDLITRFGYMFRTLPLGRWNWSERHGRDEQPTKNM